MRSGFQPVSVALMLMAASLLPLVGGKAVFAASQNLVELHRNAGKGSDKECLSCHSDIEKATTLTPKFKTMHRLHLESKLGTPKKCSECHQSVDLREGSASASRKQVDPGICADCHSGDVKGAKALFAK